SYHSTLRQVRVRVKLLDADKLGNTSALFEQYEQNSVKWFNEHHRGVFRWLKLWLQDDLGVTFFGKDLVHTTHIATANIALVTSSPINPVQRTPENRQELFDFSSAVGQFIGDLARHTGRELDSGLARSQLAYGEEIRYEDHKAAKFYGN